MSTSAHRLVLAAAAAALLASSLTSANAVAREPGASGSGWAGEVDVQVDGEDVRQEPLAPCEIDGVESGETEKVVVGDVATYYGGETSCGRSAAEEAEVTVAGESFVTDVLREWGGPRIRLSGFDLTCTTDENASSGRVELRGIRGIDVPQEIPPNYTVTVPGRIETADPLAKVVLNEFVTPEPPDGSMQMNAMRIELFPEGGSSLSGEIVLGTVKCDPYGG